MTIYDNVRLHSEELEEIKSNFTNEIDKKNIEYLILDSTSLLVYNRCNLEIRNLEINNLNLLGDKLLRTRIGEIINDLSQDILRNIEREIYQIMRREKTKGEKENGRNETIDRFGIPGEGRDSISNNKDRGEKIGRAHV